MIGQSIGKYRVLDRIGRGGMGTVYRAVDEMLHREVAIKVLNAELNDPEVAKRFRAEAITVARLSHPGIATIFELFQHDGQWLMVMEFVRGETLEHLVDRSGTLSPQRAAELCMQVLAALAHAHSMGVVHRDLKPANLMLTENGVVKVMDFGIARVAGAEHLTSAGFMMGTPAYMAPEQVLGGEIDARADLYAMGVVFYRLITAKLPFKGDTAFAMAQSQVHDQPTPIRMVRMDVPPWAEEIVWRALAKAPEGRFQSAVEFHEAFARGLAGVPITATTSSSAITEMVMTPPRLPTGGFATRFPTPAYPMPTGSVSTPSPMPATAESPTMESSSAVVPKLPVSRKGTVPVALAAIAILGALGVGGFFWLRPRPASPAPAAVTPPAETSAAPAIPAPPPVNPLSGTAQPSAPAAPPSTSVAPAPQTARGTAAAAPSLPATPPSGRAAADPSVTTPAPPSAPAPSPGAPAETAEAHVAFGDVRLLMISGRKAQEQNALLSFVGGQISVLAREGGTTLASVPYDRIEAATYTHARNPKWNRSLFAPPDDLDMPGTFLRTARHWLVLQGRSSYLIVRLDGNNWLKVLQTIEARTGLKVERVQ